MASAIADAGRPVEATGVAHAALALKPGDPNALATLAAAALRAGDLEEAERSAQAAVAKNPNHSQALLTLGEIRLSRADVVGAELYLAKAVEIEPDEPARLLEYGQVLAQLGRNKHACMTWQRTARSLVANDGDRARASRLSAEIGCAGVGPP
jgi:cytochrome c-type biogenesis protein CcmH/NrfG